MGSPIKKYLDFYAESIPEISGLANDLGGSFDFAVVIPAHNELNDLIPAINSLAKSADFCKKKILTIVVANAKKSTPQQVIDKDFKLQKHLKQQTIAIAENDQNNSFIGQWNENPNSKGQVFLFYLDRISYESRFPDNQGVGLARKTGNDLATMLFARGLIQSDWIFNTDADVLLPDDYLNIEHHIQHHKAWRSSNRPVVGGMYEFCHSYNHLLPQQKDAAELYDSYLKTYAKYLEKTGSRYAFSAIGSLFFFNVDAYCHVRGIPKRLAGEDFYFLNKLNKIGSIVRLNYPTITIKSRLVPRTPFGTSTAIGEILKNQKSYDLDERWFQSMQNILKKVEILLKKEELVSPIKFLENVGQIDQSTFNTQCERDLKSIIKSLKLLKLYETSFNKSSNPNIRIESFRDTFDGLKTFQFINLARKISL